MFLYEEAVGTNSARSEPMENHAVERTAVDSNSTCCWCLILTFGLVAHYTDPNPNVDRNDTSSHAEGDNGVFGRPTDFSHIIPVQVKSRKSKERFTETENIMTSQHFVKKRPLNRSTKSLSSLTNWKSSNALGEHLYPAPPSLPGVFADMNHMFNRLGVKFDKYRITAHNDDVTRYDDNAVKFGDVHLMRLHKACKESLRRLEHELSELSKQGLGWPGPLSRGESSHRKILGVDCDRDHAAALSSAMTSGPSIEIDWAFTDDELSKKLAGCVEYEVLIVSPTVTALIKKGSIDGDAIISTSKYHQPHIKVLFVDDAKNAPKTLADFLRLHSRPGVKSGLERSTADDVAPVTAVVGDVLGPGSKQRRSSGGDSAYGNFRKSSLDIFKSNEYQAFGFTKLDHLNSTPIPSFGPSGSEKDPNRHSFDELTVVQAFEKLSKKIDVTLVYTEVLQLKGESAAAERLLLRTIQHLEGVAGSEGLEDKLAVMQRWAVAPVATDNAGGIRIPFIGDAMNTADIAEEENATGNVFNRELLPSPLRLSGATTTSAPTPSRPHSPLHPQTDPQTSSASGQNSASMGLPFPMMAGVDRGQDHSTNRGGGDGEGVAGVERGSLEEAGLARGPRGPSLLSGESREATNQHRTDYLEYKLDTRETLEPSSAEREQQQLVVWHLARLLALCHRRLGSIYKLKGKLDNAEKHLRLFLGLSEAALKETGGGGGGEGSGGLQRGGAPMTAAAAGPMGDRERDRDFAPSLRDISGAYSLLASILDDLGKTEEAIFFDKKAVHCLGDMPL